MSMILDINKNDIKGREIIADMNIKKLATLEMQEISAIELKKENPEIYQQILDSIERIKFYLKTIKLIQKPKIINHLNCLRV